MLPAPTPPSYSSGHTALPESHHTPSVTAAPVPRGLDAHDDTPTAPSSFVPTLYHYDGTIDHYATPHHHPSSYLYSPSVPAPPALWPPHTQPHPVLDAQHPYTQDQYVHQSFNHPTSDPQIYYSYFPSVSSQFDYVPAQYGADSSSLASYALPAAATLPTSYTAPNLAFAPGVPKLEDFSAQSPLTSSTSVPQWPFTWTPPHAAPLPFHRPVLISPGSASGLDRALDEQRITLRVVPAPPRDPSPAPTLASDAASGSPANTPQPSILSPPSSSSSPPQVVALALCSPPPMAHLPLPDEEMQEDYASPTSAVPSEYQFVADPAAFPGPDQPAPVPRKRSIQVSTAVPHEPSASSSTSSASTSISSSPPISGSTPSASSASSPGSSSPPLATPSSAKPLAQPLPPPTPSRARTGSSSRKVPQPPGTTRKKPALACLFCRERKIACGPPPQGSEDMTCSQCKRRHRKCEFPKENRRGQHRRHS